MRKLLFLFLFVIACQQEDGNLKDYGNLKFEAKLPKLLNEVSGIQYDAKRDAFWMLNDSGNDSSIYLVTEKGKLLKEVKVNSDNEDWEDITQDPQGNVYVGDFGNNANKRKNLQILKLNKESLDQAGKVEVSKTFFSFPEQKAFPPKKKYFDVESFFVFQDSFYIFTKSRVKNKIGRTFLYKVPNKSGTFKAELISNFTTCKKKDCWITGADISDDGKKVALVNHKSAWIFSDFTQDDFFSGKAKEFKFKHNSQKESITFKNDSIIYVADEDELMNSRGRNLYSLTLKPKS